MYSIHFSYIHVHMCVSSSDPFPLITQYRVFVPCGILTLLLSCFSRDRLCATLWSATCRLLCPRDFQARILEWVAMPSSRGPSWPRDRTWVSCSAGNREGTYVCLWLIHVVVWQKPTQLCKIVILQLKENKRIHCKKNNLFKMQLIKFIQIFYYELELWDFTLFKSHFEIRK